MCILVFPEQSLKTLVKFKEVNKELLCLLLCKDIRLCKIFIGSIKENDFREHTTHWNGFSCHFLCSNVRSFPPATRDWERFPAEFPVTVWVSETVDSVDEHRIPSCSPDSGRTSTIKWDKRQTDVTGPHLPPQPLMEKSGFFFFLDLSCISKSEVRVWPQRSAGYSCSAEVMLSHALWMLLAEMAGGMQLRLMHLY